MAEVRRIPAGGKLYLSTKDVRAALEAEEAPAATEALLTCLFALAKADTPMQVTLTMAGAPGQVRAAGRCPDGREAVLSVAEVGAAYARSPRLPGASEAPDPRRPLALAEVATHIDPGDEDFAALLHLLHALAE